MEKTSLTGIERDLVLHYLIDGNVPVTVMALEGNESSKTGVFPIAIGSDELKVLKQGIILLNNPPQSIQDFSNKKVRVQFYFNKLGLFFDTEMKEVSTGLALVIPNDIKRIQDLSEESKKNSADFKVVLLYSPAENELNFECTALENYNVVEQPKWVDVEEKNARRAKEILEKIVMENRSESGNSKNGAHLISVSRFLASDDENINQVGEIEGRLTAPKVIFVDHERIVFASSTENMILKAGNEYAMKIMFPTGMAGPLKTREIFVTCIVEKIYKSGDEKKSCVVCCFSTIKTEDMRFLYEKTKNELLE